MNRGVASIAWLYVLLAACGADAPPARMCASDEDCRRGVCVADAAKPHDLEPLQLACGEESANGGDVGERCESAENCARGICLLAGACAMPCASDDQCGPLERCQDTFARTAKAMLQPVRTCVSMVTLPKDARVMVDVREDALTGVTMNGTTLILPLDTIGLPGATPTTWFVLEHMDDTSWPDSTHCRPPLCPITLQTRDKKPAVLFDRTEVDKRCLESASPEQFTGPRNTVNDDDHANPIVVMVPNGPESIVTDGGYKVAIEDEVPGDLRLITIAHDTADNDGSARTLDLDVYWVGMDSDESFFGDAIDKANEIFEAAAIQLDVRQHVWVGGGLPGRGATFDEPNGREGFTDLEIAWGVHAEQPALFRLSAGAGAATVNVFLVEDIEQGANGNPEGKSGGTPGPPGMHGTGSSGIVIELGLLSGRTLAHEIGHYLGLFHTSEQPSGIDWTSACVLEPLTDTPECHIDRNVVRSTDGQPEYLDCEECADAGADNLMFSFPCPNSKLSPQQIAILRTAPVLHR